MQRQTPEATHHGRELRELPFQVIAYEARLHSQPELLNARFGILELRELRSSQGKRQALCRRERAKARSERATTAAKRFERVASPPALGGREPLSGVLS